MLSRLKLTEDAETVSTDPTVTTRGDLDRIALQGTADWKRLLSDSAYPNSANQDDSRRHHVKRTHSPPRLDGKLDDACWQSDEPAMKQGSLQLRFASDRKYFYVAVVCPSQDLAIDRAVTFYERLGIKFELHSHGKGPKHYASETCGFVFEIYPQRDESSATISTRLGFNVDSVDDCLELLASLNVEIISPAKDSPWGRRAVVRDLTGTR